jgi:hypothetical protein
MFGIPAKLCLFLLYIFNIIQAANANPRTTQNNYKCIRLNEPPYFYCNLSSEKTKLDDEIFVRTIPRNEKESYSIYSNPSTMTSDSSTPSSFMTNKNIQIQKDELQETVTMKQSLKFEKDFSTTKELNIFTTTASGFSSEPSSLSTENARTTTIEPKKDDDSFIISEFSQPFPSNRGPTIMEELFIDTLTKSFQQQNHEEEPSYDPFHTEFLTYSNRQLFALCRRFLPFAREHCHREWTHPSYISQCRGYFQDCERFILRSDPLKEASRALQMNVRYGNPGFPFRHVPQYY